MFKILINIQILLFIIFIVVDCASSKKVKPDDSTADVSETIDETFDPLTLNDDDITFAQPKRIIKTDEPVYFPRKEIAPDSEIVEENKLVDGYRVQILSTKDLENATRAKAIAMEQFEDIRTKFYLEFDSPQYKVRIGDFQSRPDAEGIRKVVRSRGYPQAWIVKTKVWSNPQFPVEDDSTSIDSPDMNLD